VIPFTLVKKLFLSMKKKSLSGKFCERLAKPKLSDGSDRIGLMSGLRGRIGGEREVSLYCSPA
jgi:hypothetical protein